MVSHASNYDWTVGLETGKGGAVTNSDLPRRLPQYKKRSGLGTESKCQDVIVGTLSCHTIASDALYDAQDVKF